MLTTKLTTLHNGLPVLTVAMPSVRSLTTLVLTNTGSRYEQQEQAGIAHFFEHMVFKGTDKFQTSQELASVIDAIGADSNAFTSKEYTGYYVKSASQHMSTSLEVLSDMLLKPLLRQEDIDREKGVIIEEINMYKDNPMYHVANLFEQMVYADFSLNHDIIGTKETVSSLKSADFSQFLSRWYGLPNMLLVLAGDERVINDPATFELIQEKFSKHPATDRVHEKMKPAKFISSNPMSSNFMHIENKKTEQAHLVLGWPGISRHDEELKPAFSVMNVLMGGNMSSRLFSEVREKRGLCYYVHSDADFYHETGIAGASAGVDPSRVYEAIEVILAEFDALATAKKPVTAEELSRAKEYIRGTMTLSLEDSKSVAQHFGMKQLLLDKVESVEEALEKIQKVTQEEVAALASQLFTNEQPRLTVIGPFEDQDKFAQLIGIQSKKSN